jgi:putative OPT family oligopeptide transporter
LRAVLLGIALSMVLAGANAYLGLFAGLTVSASIPAAVVSMGLLRLLGNSQVLENNAVQTSASAGEAIAAGAIFTFPALILLGHWNVFDYWWVCAIAGFGGLLGVIFTVPLRRALVVEQALAFPEGTATAAVLRAGHGEQSGLRRLVLAALAGAGAKLAESGLRLWSGTAEAAGYVGNSIGYFGANLSPALLSVGYIVGLNIATLVFIGGAISWFVAIPIYYALHAASDPALKAVLDSGADAAQTAGFIWSTKIRYLGVGGMLIGGVWALISMRSSLGAGIRGVTRISAAGDGDETDRDLPLFWMVLILAACVVPIGWMYFQVVPSLAVSLPMTVVMVVAGFLFSAVSGYMAGIVGSSNNPISGLTIATILMASLLMLFTLGANDPSGPAAAILIGAVVCCAAAIGGDNLQDLKAGFILGATPWKQQVMQMIGVVSAVLVIAPILNLLLQAYGIGAPTAEHPDALAAPQATLMATVVQGVFGGDLPWDMVSIGALIGAAFIFLDERLKHRNAAWRTPVLAVAVGIYLPLELSVPIFAGGLIAHWADRAARRRYGAAARHPMGILLAAGMITGEALMGIFLAVPIVMTGNRSVLALADEPLGGTPGIAIVALLGVWLYRVAASRPLS